MTADQPKSVTELLVIAGQGDNAAHRQLWELIHGELHLIAERQTTNEASGRTLQTTTLVNEASVRLVGEEEVQWPNGRHFFAAALNATRRIRLYDACKRKRRKRGGGRKPVQLEIGGPAAFAQDPDQVLALEMALKRLEQVDPRKAEMIMLRYLSGLSIDESTPAMKLSPRTVDSEWPFARAWLHHELEKGDIVAG